ncbi:SMI1/KNR4 family protein [Streptacidiphilus melanogenes]|uniref:SMI1/KNR4 family protein n=1 Tax=Streptacidiphilus melanogenes TaxID=411235 RepID=UPI000693FB56|nr:SMI1/KNR4 family protein [Streptacidiphilus melanogenes]
MNRRDDIMRLLPPPAREVPPADWSAVVAYLGADLPVGYKWFVETYGTGTLGAGGFDRMLFRHPNQVLAGRDIVGQMEFMRECLLGRRDRGHDSRPVFPEPGGLVGFAASSEDFEFYFAAEPDTDPDAWPVVWHDFADYGDTRWAEFPQGFERFLHDLIRGEIPKEVTGESRGYTEFLPVEPGTRYHSVEGPVTDAGTAGAWRPVR